MRVQSTSPKNEKKEAIEDYKKNPAKQALVAELDRKNEERENQIVRL